MSARVYIRHSSGRQNVCSESELEALKADGWYEERRVEVVEKPAKKKAAPKKKAK
jgi:hypothetical protein